MTSFKAWMLYWACWFLFKYKFQTVEGMRGRIKKEKASPNDKPAKHIYKKCNVKERKVGDYTVYDISPKSEKPVKARVLFIHGGAFVLEVLPLHFDTVAALAEELHAAITLPVYTVGPERKLKDLFEVLQPLHDEMAASKDKTPFFLMGDSAGGSITTVLTQQALKSNKPITPRLVLICPAVDWTFNNPEIPKLAANDVVLDLPGCVEGVRISRGDWETDDPRISPTFGDLDRLPPMMVFMAELDMLTPDTKLFVEKVRSNGREVVVVEGESMVHDWPTFPMPEGDAARVTIVKWLEEAI